MSKQRATSTISSILSPERVSSVRPSELTKLPLRAGYNSIVPDIEKWRQFDHDLNNKRKLRNSERGQMWQSHLLKQWQLVLDKLHLSSAGG